MNNSYHNTNQESGDTLIASQQQAKTQDEKVLEYFKNIVPHKFSPEEVWSNLYAGTNVPLTSCRRSFSNLCKENKLIKTEEQVTGMYGKMINLWVLPEFRQIDNQQDTANV